MTFSPDCSTDLDPELFAVQFGDMPCMGHIQFARPRGTLRERLAGGLLRTLRCKV